MSLYKDKRLNILSGSELAVIWSPTIVFVTTENGDKAKADNSSTIILDKISSYELDETDLHETAYFSGSETLLRFTKYLTLDFKCQFELERYPFDTQTCAIVIVAPFKEEVFVKLIPNMMLYTGPVEMITYYVVDYHIAEAERPGALVATIQLKRLVSRHLLSTYLPSLCILIITQVFLAKYQ